MEQNTPVTLHANKSLLSSPCRSCIDCEGVEHHWIESVAEDFPDTPILECKHCPVVVVMPDDWPENADAYVSVIPTELDQAINKVRCENCIHFKPPGIIFHNARCKRTNRSTFIERQEEQVPPELIKLDDMCGLFGKHWERNPAAPEDPLSTPPKPIPGKVWLMGILVVLAGLTLLAVYL